jgi:hypothetical protein
VKQHNALASVAPPRSAGARGAYVQTVSFGMYATTQERYEVSVSLVKHSPGPNLLHQSRSAPLRSCLHPERRIHLDKKRRDVCATRRTLRPSPRQVGRRPVAVCAQNNSSEAFSRSLSIHCRRGSLLPTFKKPNAALWNPHPEHCLNIGAQ